jgi:TP53 regulating kinase-like protein
MKLLRMGAEANIYETQFMGRRAVLKRRIRKGYRLQQIDRKIRDFSTVHEAQLLHEAKRAGVATPIIYFIDRAKSEIIMEYVDGRRLKDCLEEVKPSKRIRLCFLLGKLIATLHRHGIIHGDLTTSNVIITPDGKMFLLDFGLGFYSKVVEDQGVDLHLLKQVFQSFHIEHAGECFEAVLRGYETVLGRGQTVGVKKKIREIDGRGRYIPVTARTVG